MARPRTILPLHLVMEACAGGPLPEWQRLAEACSDVHLEPGEHLFKRGDTDPDAFVLWRGLLKAHGPIDDQPSRTLAYYEENQLVISVPGVVPDVLQRYLSSGVDPRAAELGFVTEAAAVVSVTALEASDLVRLPVAEFRRLAARHVDWANLVSAVLVADALALGADALRARTLSAEARYAQLSLDRPRLVDRLTQRELANFLGVTESALSRILKRRRQGASVG